jgi:hypothetical protein
MEEVTTNMDWSYLVQILMAMIARLYINKTFFELVAVKDSPS